LYLVELMSFDVYQKRQTVLPKSFARMIEKQELIIDQLSEF
jgi:hypothetical protein